jgi:hypothetical protein
MSNEEFPDSWVVLKIEDGDRYFYKVLAGFRGSYLYGNSWRLNSGIIGVGDSEVCWKFYGESGSCYYCNKEGYGVTSAIMEPFLRLTESGRATMMLGDTDWINLLGGRGE